MINWNKSIYIATQKEIDTNEYGVDEVTYNRPIKYRFNYQPTTGQSEIMTYGDRVTKMYSMYINRRLYDGKFHEGDLAYIEGITPEGENYNGEKANYRISSVRPQNLVIAIYMERIQD